MRARRRLCPVRVDMIQEQGTSRAVLSLPGQERLPMPIIAPQSTLYSGRQGRYSKAASPTARSWPEDAQLSCWSGISFAKTVAGYKRTTNQASTKVPLTEDSERKYGFRYSKSGMS